MSARSIKPKLTDVAHLAGCSPATVSRVLNDNPAVGGDVRTRVVNAAAQLGYVPNGSARALRSTRTRLVGAVIPTLDHAIYAAMVDGLQARLSERNVGLIISTSMYDSELEFDQVRLLIERGAESIILVGSMHTARTIALLEQHRLSYVFTYTSDSPRSGAAVGFDNEKAGQVAARFLLDLGHKRFAMIAGVTHNNDRAAGRVAGFLRELVKHGIERGAVQVIEEPYSVGAGNAAMKKLLESPTPPTAVFCGSDILAAGAVKYCVDAGIDVPRSISILGFDNLEIAELTTPELTTLEVPAREMGRLAGDYVLASPAQRRHLHQRELSIRLVVRRSTGPAPSS